MEEEVKQPLKGVRVLDFTNLLPGPFCSYLLQLMGAEVIKVERKDGDPARRMIPGLFDIVNYGKKSIVLDLKEKGTSEILEKAVSQVDVVLEGFRPGVKYNVGIDYETVKRINPNIVYCSISGYGQSGHLADLPGHDINFLALAGVYSLSGDPFGEPVSNLGIAVGDLTASWVAFSSILLALRSRDIYGIGDYIDVSMVDCALSMMINRIGEYTTVNDPLTLRRRLARPAYGIFKTLDQHYIAIAALEDHFWERLCRLFNWDDFLNDEEMGTMGKRSSMARKINDRLQQEIALREFSEWERSLSKFDIPFSKVNSIADLEDDMYFKERGVLAFNDGKAYMNFPAKFSNILSHMDQHAPEIGEHTEEVFAKWGIPVRDV